MKRRGFTLIEVLIVIAIGAVLMISLTGIVGGSLRTKTRIFLGDRLETNGKWILGEMRRQIINVPASRIDCPTVGSGSSMAVTDANNVKTVFYCFESSKISSESAMGVVDLIDSSQVRVSSCSSFVSCDTVSSAAGDSISRVKIDFDLSAGDSAAGPAGYVEKNFQMEVTIRN